MRRCPLALFLVASVACSKGPSRNNVSAAIIAAPDLGDVVATVDSAPIFAKQVAAKAKATNTSVRQALDEIVQTYLLAELSHRRGTSTDLREAPDVRSAMVQRLLERDLEPYLRPETLPDSALRPIYDKTRDHFVHSRLVEVAVLAVYTGPLMQRPDREPREQTARELAAFLKSHPVKTLDDFEAIAADAQWKARHVTLRRFQQSLDSPLSAKVGKEVAKLRGPGDTTPMIIDESGGFIARYVSETPAENTSFEAARGELADMFYEKVRQQLFIELSGKLGQAHRVQVFFDRLSTNDEGP